MLTELALSDGGGLYKWAGAILVLLVTVWWARKQSAATKRSSDPALACGDTFEEGVSFASVLDIPELRKLIERHHDGDREPADPATHDLEDTIQVVHSGASKLSQVVKVVETQPVRGTLPGVRSHHALERADVERGARAYPAARW